MSQTLGNQSVFGPVSIDGLKRFPANPLFFWVFNHMQTGWDGGFTVGVVLPPLLPQTPLPLLPCMCFELEQWWVGEARAALLSINSKAKNLRVGEGVEGDRVGEVGNYPNSISCIASKQTNFHSMLED